MRHSTNVVRAAAAVLCVMALALPAAAKNGAFRSTAHGDALKGPQRRTDAPRGSCIQCHEQHASHDPDSRFSSTERILFAPNDNNLCFTCHVAPSQSGAFSGAADWSRGGHANSPAMFGRGRNASDTGKCVNCHDPHGSADRDGVIPAMLIARDEALCLDCHDGSRGADIRSQMLRGYVHGDRARGRHRPGEEDPASFAAFPAENRHVSCSDCHNIHQAFTDPAPPSAAEPSSRLAGVSRVEVVSGGAGVVPNYRFRGAGDPGPVRDFEVCFKCHSSWTVQPGGQPDIARLTSPANASFHPIQAEGKNRDIDRAAFVGDLTSRSRIGCGDCHTSDDASVRGPHGSAYPYLLKKPTSGRALLAAERMSRNDICFDCHTYDVYADAAAGPEIQRASRFNAPSTSGHAFHVGSQHLACYSCHETHGSPRNASLIASRRPDGISSYSQTPVGGTCTSTCHEMRNWTVNYSR